MRKARGDLTQGSLLKHLLRLAGPIILSYILQDAFNIIDMIFVGRLGPGAIAAVGVSGNLLRLIGVFSLGISTGAGIMVAQYLGARDRAQAEHIVIQSILLAVFFSICVTLVGYPLAKPGLLAVRMKDPEVLRLGTTYMHIVLIGISTMFLSMTLGSIFRAGGDAFTPMFVLIFSTVINIALDPLLIFGLWGFPKLGVAGSAYATLIGRGVGVVVLLYLCWTGRAPVSLIKCSVSGRFHRDARHLTARRLQFYARVLAACFKARFPMGHRPVRQDGCRRIYDLYAAPDFGDEPRLRHRELRRAVGRTKFRRESGGAR